MTVHETNPQSPAADATGADARRERAIHTLRDAAFAALLAAGEPQRTTDLARAVAERCELPTDENTVGAVALLLRMVLDGDAAFAHIARMWGLTAWDGQGEVDRRRPVERTIEELLQMVGRPAAAHEVAPLVAAIYGRDADYYRGMIERMAPTRPQFFVAPFGRVGLTRWLLELTSDEPIDIEMDNFASAEELEPVRAAVAKHSAQDTAADEAPLDYARTLLEAVDVSLTNRALTFAIWERFRDVEPLALFNDLLVTLPEALRPGPVWEGAATRAANRAAIRELADSPELAQSALAASAPTEETVAAPVPTQTVADEDLEQVYNYMANDLRTYRLSELCQEVLESFPGSRTYPAVRDALMGRMRADSRFVWVGTERFRLDGTMPDEVEAVPEGLTFDEKQYTDDEGQESDKLLPPARWKHLLEEQVQDPLVQDLGDDDTMPAETPNQVRVVIPMHHYVAGTLYILSMNRPLFPLEPDLVSLVLVTPEGERQEVWLNNRLGLIFGLKEWYDANLPWTGGTFVLEPTQQPDEYQLTATGETEPALDIPMERLQTLLQLRLAAESEAMPLATVLTRLLKGQPGGIPFVRLFGEVNVVRRSRRALVASVLSGSRGFQQKPDQPGVWFFDEKRAEKASRKGGRPKRFHEIEDEDELEDE
jgi:hypothetical protein